MSRWPVAFILIGLLAAGLAYDRVVGTPAETTTAAASDDVVITPSIADPPRLDQAWYCPVGSSSSGGFADHQVNISNLGDAPAVANLNILTGDGPGPGQRIELPPRSTERVILSETQVVDVAGAVVEIIGGRGAVGHTVTTAEGVAEGPCATQASSSWYFAAGRTTRDSTHYLALMNPFPQPASFDIEFQAVGRSREPGPLQGATVAPRSVRLIDVGEFVAREENLATKITTKRGKLVVERLQVLNGALGPRGAALQLGVPTPAASWIFTAGRVHDAGDDFLTVYNPFDVDELDDTAPEVADARPAGNGAAAAAPVDEPDGGNGGGGDGGDGGDGGRGDDGGGEAVDDTVDRRGFVNVAIELWPSNPTDLSNYSVVTIEREVRPGTFVTVNLRDQAERFEFPLPYELGVNVTSLEGLPIVAERWQFAQRATLDGLGPVEEDSATAEEEGADAEATTDDGTVADGEGADDTAGSADAAEGDDGAVDPAPAELQPAETVTDLPQPIATAGISTTRGNERLSTRWVIPWVRMEGDSTLIAVASPEEAALEVRLLIGGQFVGPIRATVPRGGRAIVPVTAAQGGATVEVVADTPVSVEAMVVVADESLDVVPAVPTVAG